MVNPAEHNGVAAAKPWPNQGSAPVLSYTPTDTTIPPSLYDKVPNLELYKKLLDAERKIDLLTTRKTLDFQKMQAKTAHPLSYHKKVEKLRVFIYNTCSNQPWQKQLELQKSGGNQMATNLADNSDSSWTLRIEGRFLGETEPGQPQPSFSSFLSGISVDLIPNENYPHLQNAPNNVVEWRNQSAQVQNETSKLPNYPASNASSNGQAQFDGLDIKRNGVSNIRCKIALLTKSQWSQLKLSSSMAQFVGKQEATQQELVFLIWQYVLYKGLLNKSDSLTNVPAVSVTGANGNFSEDNSDITVVECDDVLQKLLNVASFRFSDLYKLLQQHFQPREPIILDYEIDTTRSTTLGDIVIDIPVDVPANLSEVQQEMVQSSKSLFEKLTKTDALSQQLNAKISLGVVALQNAYAREQFYREFSQDPVQFMKNWLESQSETLRVLKSDEGYDEDVVRRGEYYEKNEDSLRDSINILLGSGKI